MSKNWVKFLRESRICYQDEVGNMPCDNGVLCDKCQSDHIQEQYEQWKVKNDIKDFTEEELKRRSVIEKCPYCDGKGYNTIERDLGDSEHAEFCTYDEECSVCKGDGVIEKDIQSCGNCGELYLSDELTWVNDNYGIPFKKVCSDCYDKVVEYLEEELGNYADYTDERIDEDY